MNARRPLILAVLLPVLTGASVGCSALGKLAFWKRDPAPTQPVAVEKQPAASAEAADRRPTPLVAAHAGWDAPPPGRAAIECDILLVNSTSLTADQVVYALEQSGKLPPPTAAFGEVERAVVPRVQQEIGAILLYQKADARLSDQIREVVDKRLDEQIHRRIAAEFGESAPRFEAHLAEHGLTRQEYKDWLKRQLVARDYAREHLAPQIRVSRDDLLALYREKTQATGRPETRELLMIEAPFAAFLDPPGRWEDAAGAERNRAEAAAEAHIRAAYTALTASRRAFVDVAAEFDRGAHRSSGGSWGLIGRPLRAPYDDVTRAFFTYGEGERSTPTRIAQGWVIVQCGRIDGPLRKSFEESQDDLREELLDQRFNELSAKYLIQLAENASISSIESFMNVVLRRVMAERDGSPRVARGGAGLR